MAAEIANHKKTSRELFTFEFICESIGFVFPEASENLIEDLVRMIAFDAIVGNNDRHFYNWGVINSVKKSQKMPRFAPLYDSARGLFWNESEQNIVKHHAQHGKSGKKIVNYLEGAKPRISVEADADINHFGLIKFLNESKPKYSEIIFSLVSVANEERVIRTLEGEVFKYFSRERRELVTLILRERFKTLRGI